MSIDFSYEIIAVNEAAKCMEVVYTAQGRQTMHIGARLPFEGETLEAVIRMYAPVRYWEEQELTVVAPAVGTSGFLSAAIISEVPLPADGQTGQNAENP
jgi:hypothetical protein